MDKAPDAFRTISEVADDLKVPQHVLRFWESRFAQIKPMKRAGGRRYYRPDDVELLRGIHHLLYGEGYTIRGVQRLLRDQGIRFVQSAWHADTALPARNADDEEFNGDESLDRGEPDIAPPMQAPQAQASADMSREDLRKLQATLFELQECRRLLDAVNEGN